MKSIYFAIGLLFILGFISCGDGLNNNDETITLTQDDFSSELTLENHDVEIDYYINESISMDFDLIIKPGVTISFGENGSLAIEPNGSIEAIGTETEQITFTGEVQIKGSWKGIIISSSSLKNQFTYCTIEYAGKPSWNNGIQGGLSTWVGASFGVRNCAFLTNKNYGIETYFNNVNVTSFENNFFENNDRPLSISPGSFHQLGQGNVYNDLDNHIHLKEYPLFETDQNDETYVWKDQGIPIRILFNLRVSDNTLQIDEGVVLEFNEEGYIEFNGGFLKAKGSALAPIVFTGIAKSPDSWPGIYIGATGGVQNSMEHCIVEYAGSEHPTFSTGIVYLVSDPKLSVSNCIFSESSRCVFEDNNSGGGAFVNLVESENEYVNTGLALCQ
jgi:hypothetical protein